MPRTLARLAGLTVTGRFDERFAPAGEVSELISQAEQALANGDRARADALLMRVKAVDPEHPRILNEDGA
jgi:hypothetical protein